MPRARTCLENLNPKGPRIHDLKKTDSIEHIEKNISQKGRNFISLESAKNITSVRDKIN